MWLEPEGKLRERVEAFGQQSVRKWEPQSETVRNSYLPTT